MIGSTTRSRTNTTCRTRRSPLLASALAGVLGLLSLAAEPAEAAGLLVADGGLGGVLEIAEHDVDVTINNGIAVTSVTQVFRNTEDRQLEALYTFPIPKGASVSEFSMWIGGKEMVGEVVEKQRRRGEVCGGAQGRLQISARRTGTGARVAAHLFSPLQRYC